MSFRIGHGEHPYAKVAIDRRRYVRVAGADEVVYSVDIVNPEPNPRPQIPEPVLPVDAAVEPDFAVANHKIDIADDSAIGPSIALLESENPDAPVGDRSRVKAEHIRDDPADRGSCDHRFVGHGASHVWTVRDPVSAEVAITVLYRGDLVGVKDRILLIVTERVSEVVISRPRGRLCPFIDRYVGYRQTGFAPGLHRGLPSRHLTFILSLDNPVEVVASPDPTQTPSSFQGLVCGLHTRAALIRHDGNEHGIAIELTPLGARAVFGLPAIELSTSVLGLDELLGRRGRHLIERLLQAPDWPARFAVLDDVLSAGLGETATELPAEVQRAWHGFTTDPGTATVAALAAEVGWSRRHLTRRFHQEVGLPPRQISRVIRFERSRSLLLSHIRRSRTLSELAVASGFYDQAHMLHQWNDLAGCAPLEWLAEELPPLRATVAVA